jgi:hypothetical protein
MRVVARAAVVVAVLLLPSLVSAQELAGTVRDSSGAVLPGVTVEAASPVLIEKVRTTTTDGTGQYRIPNLRPGTYTVTFALPGFTTVKRDAVEVSGAQVITINADMRVSAVQETITVTGETPVVDVQTSTRKQTVLDDSVIAVLPASRGYGNLLATVPGISGTGLDVSSNVSTNFFTARGGRGNEGTIQIDGMNVGSAFNGGGVAGFGYDTANAAEIQVTIAGGLGETDRGGPQFNMIPKTGGNDFSGTFFLSTAGEWSQGSNLDDELRSFGITEGAALIKNWDTNFAMGGPILRDRLWFFGNLRTYGQHTDIPGLYGNRNAGNPNAWFYERDLSLKSRAATAKRIGAIRLTSQLTPKNKAGFYYDYQKNCTGSSLNPDGDQCRQPGDGWVALGSIGGFGSVAPEAHNVWDDREKIVQGSWSSTATSRLLLEAGVSSFNSRWGGQQPSGALTTLIPVTELSPLAGVPVPNFTYRGWQSSPSNDQQHNVWRASLAYVTGAHNMKFGYQAAFQVQKQFQYAGSQVQYTFNNRVPTQFQLRIAPHMFSNRTRYDAFYAQDQWTMNRLTIQAGLRYEHAWSWYPEGENGIIADNQFSSRFLFPETEGVKGYHDITPRVGAAYDVFGNGKTSLKGNFSKYLQPANNEGTFTIRNPGLTLQTTTTRSWTDANGNFAIDCGALNVNAVVDNRPTGGDFCGPFTNANFGNALQTTRVNPEVLEGWGIRPYDWQFSLAVQQEVLPRVSVEVGYNRRSWGNFFVIDNAAIGVEDFNRVTVTAPSNANLPNGGGYPVTFMVRNGRTPLGATDNYYTSASDYGDVTYYWQGVDVTVNARMANGVTFQGGTSSGAGRRNNCEVTAKVPELLALSFPFTTQPVDACDVEEPWLTSFRGLVAYTVPRIEVFLSASMRSVPNTQPDAGGVLVASNGTSLGANRNFTGAEVPGGLAPGVPFQAVNLLLPGQQYGERVNAMDLRFGKIVRFAGTRTNVALDLYNLFNANTGTAYNQTYDALSNGATWLRPTAILNPRFVRFNVTFDF